MKITTIGRGAIGGTLARLWRSAGHEVSELGRDGGDAAGADVVLLAVPYSAVPDALAGVTGLNDRVAIDATNRLGGEDPPGGHASITEYVEAETTGPVAKAFNLNFGRLFDRAAAAMNLPNNIWVLTTKGGAPRMERRGGAAVLHLSRGEIPPVFVTATLLALAILVALARGFVIPL